MRRAFLKRVADMIRNEADTTFFTVDIGMWAIRDVLAEFPDRCTNVGIYEDGMISIAAGMARRGLVPTIFGIQPYLIERTLEQIKMDLAYQKLGVNIVGTGAAVDYPKYGYSHYCAEDVHVIKAIPGCEFIAPGSAKQFIQLFNSLQRIIRSSSFIKICNHMSIFVSHIIPNDDSYIIKFQSLRSMNTSRLVNRILINRIGCCIF